MKKTKATPSILERASRMARRPLPVSSKDELKQKTQNPQHVTKAFERSKKLLEDLDSFSNDIASYSSTAMTDSVVTDTSFYTSTSASAATAPLHSDAVEIQPTPASNSENYPQLPNADTGSEKIHMDELRVSESPKEYQVEERERGDDGETEDCYFSDEEDYGDYVYESLLDETEFAQGICGYIEGFEPPVIHDISAAHSARRKFSDEQIPSSIIENDDNLICANCGGCANGCGGGQFCC
jgi:hypothetical protein